MKHEIDLIILQVLLKSKFRTQYEAAKALGIQDYLLSLYLSGRKQIPEDIIIRIETQLGSSRNNFKAREISNLQGIGKVHE